MKKTLLIVASLLMSAAMTFAQSYNYPNGYVRIFPDSVGREYGWLGGQGYPIGSPSTVTNWAYTYVSTVDGLNIKPSPSGTKNAYSDLIYMNFPIGNYANSSLIDMSVYQNIFVVIRNNQPTVSTLLNIQVGIEQAPSGTLGNNPSNNCDACAFNLDITNTANTTIYSNSFAGKFIQQYGGAGRFDSTIINSILITPNGPSTVSNSDFTIKAIGIGRQYLNPTLSSTLAGFSGANTSINSTSAVQTITVNGGILTGNATISGSVISDGVFEVSTSSTTGFSSSISVAPTNGLIQNAVVYIRYKSTSGATAGNKNGSITWTAPNAGTSSVNVSASVAVATSTNNYTLSNELFVSPNPTSEGYINVTSDLNISNISVVNAQGAPVNASVNGNRVNTSTLTPGVYTLLIDTEKGRTAKKFIVE